MHNHPQSFPFEPAHVTLKAGCDYTGDSRSTMYQAITAGLVEAVKEGKRTLLVFESLKRRVAARKPALIGAGQSDTEKFQKLRKLVKRKRRGRPRKSDHAGVEA